MDFETLSFPALILVSVTPIVILVGRDWRLILSALGVQYVGVFILVGLTWPLEMAVIKLVAGWIAAAVLGMELISSQNSLPSTPLGFSARLFRIFLAVLVGLAVLSFGAEMANWVLSATYEQLLGSLFLVSLGIINLGITDRPFRIVVGLLTVLSGFEIIYASVETSVLVAGFFALLSLGISLLGSYLMAAPTLEGRSMSAPVVWILLPISVGIILLVFQRWKIGVFLVGMFISINLTLAALVVSIDEVVVAGTQSITLNGTISFAGLQIAIANTDRPMLVLLYGMTSFILGGAVAARVQRRFIPLSLIIIALVIGAISIKPVIYGILLFQFSALLSALILSPPGNRISQGILRFLVFQVIGSLFILLAAWLLSSGPEILEKPEEVYRVILVLGIGFIFLFSIFPLYAWVIMISQDSHPYAAIFVFSMIFGGYTLFLISILNTYSWVFESMDVHAVLRFIGVIMVATGGGWAAFQRDLGRLLGYAVVIEVGYALLSIGVQDNSLHYAMLAPRIVSLAVWGLGLSILYEYATDLRFSTVQGMGRRFPFAGAALILSHFSLSGLPLLAGFPYLMILWNQVSTFAVSQGIWSFLGSIGLMVGGLRSFAVLILGPEELPWDQKEDIAQRIYIVIGVLFLFFLGMFPNWFLSLLSDLVSCLDLLAL